MKTIATLLLLSASALADVVSFQFDERTEREPDYAGSVVYVRDDPESPWVEAKRLEPFALGEQPEFELDLDLSTPKYVTITARNTFGLESDYSNIVVVSKVKPAPHSGLRVKVVVEVEVTQP